MASETSPEQLVIALEPEAASLWCRKSRRAQLKTGSTDTLLVEETLGIGSHYMVVDCGGGTCDVTVHEVLSAGVLKEVEAASGDAIGSVAVDKEFESLLKKVFGTEFIDTYKDERPIGWVS